MNISRAKIFLNLFLLFLPLFTSSTSHAYDTNILKRLEIIIASDDVLALSKPRMGFKDIFDEFVAGDIFLSKAYPELKNRTALDLALHYHKFFLHQVLKEKADVYYKSTRDPRYLVGVSKSFKINAPQPKAKERGSKRSASIFVDDSGLEEQSDEESTSVSKNEEDEESSAEERRSKRRKSTKGENEEEAERLKAYFVRQDLRYLVDNANLEVGDSERIRIAGQKGLFATAEINKGDLIGWYTGLIYDDEVVMRSHMFPGTHRLPADTGLYIMYAFQPNYDKGTYSKLLYFINAFHPYESERCKVAFINHSKESPNTEIISIPAIGAHKGVGVAYFATRDIEANEELFADYGDDYVKAHFSEFTPIDSPYPTFRSCRQENSGKCGQVFSRIFGKKSTKKK